MKGKRLSVDGLSLFYTKNNAGSFRIGISVSKKLANAVKRNRLKRQIRDCIMRALKSHAESYDMVFVVRKELSEAPYEKILRTVETVLQRAVFRSWKSEGTAP
jgi:ribonuclease P protein component